MKVKPGIWFVGLGNSSSFGGRRFAVGTLTG